MSWVSVCAVTMMIGTMLAARISRHTSNPCRSGRRRSSSTRSNEPAGERRQALGAVGRLVHRVALVLERERQGQADLVVVLDEQQRVHGASIVPGHCHTGPVTALHWPRLARLPRLRLRTKVSVFFALLALVATVSLSTVTYTLARSSLLDQRTSAAESLAVSNARKVFEQLRAGGFTEDQKFQDIVRPEPDGFNLAHAGGTTFTADADAADAFPGALGRRRGQRRLGHPALPLRRPALPRASASPCRR